MSLKSAEHYRGVAVGLENEKLQAFKSLVESSIEKAASSGHTKVSVGANKVKESHVGHVVGELKALGFKVDVLSSRQYNDIDVNIIVSW